MISSISTSVHQLHQNRSAIKAMKNGIAAGIDPIHAEMLKADLNTSSAVLTDRFRTIWDKDTIPDDWLSQPGLRADCKGLIVKLPKKGNLQNCDNLYHPQQEQAGSRKGRGCVDQIFVLRNIIEQCLKWNTPLYINFIYFRKAFDSLNCIATPCGRSCNHMEFLQRWLH